MRLLSVLVVMVLAVLVAVPGCEKRAQTEADAITKKQPEMIVMVSFDTSGSFMTKLEKKAYPFFLAFVDKLYTNRMGSNDRLILAQISGTNKSVFWDGNPRSLQVDFPNAKQFTKDLLARPDPGGSRVYDSMTESLTYLTNYAGVCDGVSRPVAIFLTDMDDNYPEPEKSKARLVTALRKYATTGGCLGIYWCDHDRVHEWGDIIRQAGIKNWVVESEHVTDPTLPNFE